MGIAVCYLLYRGPEGKKTTTLDFLYVLCINSCTDNKVDLEEKQGTYRQIEIDCINRSLEGPCKVVFP